MTSRRRSATAGRGDAKAKASEREAKGSVHEAIGKLLGDDVAKAHGMAKKRAAMTADHDPEDPPRR